LTSPKRWTISPRRASTPYNEWWTLENEWRRIDPYWWWLVGIDRTRAAFGSIAINFQSFIEFVSSLARLWVDNLAIAAMSVQPHSSIVFFPIFTRKWTIWITWILIGIDVGKCPSTKTQDSQNGSL